MSITNNQGTLPQRAINITILITALFWFPLTVFAATSTLNDYNPYNVNIPDNGSSVNSDLALSGAPSGATITKVKVYYEIRHTYIGDLKVWLTTYYDGAWHDFVLKNREGGSADNIIETRDNLTTWNGASPNQTWYLVAQDMATGDTGYIDFFELWVTYSVNDPPNPPSSEDPSNGATGVSINNDLDWSCSDPNSDTLYYTVYFEKNDSSPDNVIKSDATGSAADPGTLDYDAHYYWQVKADDHKGGVTWSPVWDFYTEPEPVIDASITVGPIGTVQAGNSVNISYDVTNDGNVAHAFGVGAEIWKDGMKQDDVGSQTTASVSPGGTESGSFSYDIPSTWSGTYIARCAVWSGTPGSSTWLDSYDRSFTVNPESLSLNGRIAYHSYSDYMASPLDSIDGHIFVYRVDNDTLTKVTDGHPVENAMNPHFSPDGSRITFMAIPFGSERNRNSLEVYVLDMGSSSLARLTADSVPDEDPKFSPDGSLIVWKREGQIWKMNIDGSSLTQLTNTADEKSGPNYSPDGSKIVYWSDGGSSADIWWMSASGTGPAEIIGNTSIQDYYPIYRDSGNILYSRWESTTDYHDKIYNYNIGAGSSSRLPVNVTGVEDADAAPVNSTYLVMSSTRNSGEGSYDIYVGRYDNGVAYSLAAANSVYKDLGPCYSQYTYARSLTLLTPSDGSDLEAGETALLTTRLWSDAAVWAGASPVITFEGPTTVQYTGLRDDGTQGDVTPGDGIYSKTVTLPSATGSYTVSASSQSVEPGITRQVSSSSITVNITPNLAPTITVSSPNGGESWQAGTSNSITWTSTNVTGYVKIELYRVNTIDSIIMSSTSNDGSYSWSIPSTQSERTDYRIKVTSTSDTSVYDYSNSYFSITVAGRTTKQILSVSSGEHAVHPSCSPDGTKISYGMYSSTGGFDIWVMNSDGSGVPQKILDDVFPEDWIDDYISFLSSSWSPDGTKIAYTKGEGTSSPETLDIWTTNSDGSGIPLQITTVENAIMPSWSPDGKQIAYVGLVKNQGSQIWLTNSDGAESPEQITNGGFDLWPSWSPDGKQIAYTSYNTGSETHNLWVVNSHGMDEPVKIVVDIFPPSSCDPDCTALSAPSWSHDGAKICYSSYDGIEEKIEIWITNSDGSGAPQPITINGHGFLVYPAWSPDGTKILYQDYYYYIDDLHMTDYLYGDDAFPAVNIVSPILNEQISGIANVIGTVTDNISVDGSTILSSLSSWTLEYGEGEEPETWTNIVTSSTSKSNESLASWDTSALASGKYTLRLRATDGVHENVQSVILQVISEIKSDINDDGSVDLADAVLALQVMAGIEPSATVYKEADVNGDNKIGIEEVIYILQKVTGLRE